MKFGTSAVVRVGKSPATGLRGPMHGYRDGTKVQVGKKESAVKTDMKRANVRTGVDPMVDPQGACANYDWSRACNRPIAIPRTQIAAGDTHEFTVTPCGPYRLGDDQGNSFNVPTSLSDQFEITSIKVCRNDYIEDSAWPAESFNSDGPGVALGCGSVFFPSLPLKVSVKNISGAAASFSMLIFGKELAICG